MRNRAICACDGPLAPRTTAIAERSTPQSTPKHKHVIIGRVRDFGKESRASSGHQARAGHAWFSPLHGPDPATAIGTARRRGSCIRPRRRRAPGAERARGCSHRQGRARWRRSPSVHFLGPNAPQPLAVAQPQLSSPARRLCASNPLARAPCGRRRHGVMRVCPGKATHMHPWRKDGRRDSPKGMRDA